MHRRSVPSSQMPHALHRNPLQGVNPVCCWGCLAPAGQPTPYLHLARAFEAMETTKKRLRISGAALPMQPYSWWSSALATVHVCTMLTQPMHACFYYADVLVNCFRSVLALRPTAEVVQAAYLAVGKIAPDYEGAELNVSLANGRNAWCICCYPITGTCMMFCGRPA